MVDLCREGRTSFDVPNSTRIFIFVPIFLIISSSVYPAIMSSIENEERLIVSEVMAKLNMDTSDHHADMRAVPGSDIIPASSPTPIAPSSSTTSSSSNVESNDTFTPTNMQQQQVEGDDKMDITSIGAAKAVHTIWADNTPGDFDIFTTKRDGADHDPTTINISNNAGTSSSPAIAVSGNNVHVVWHDTTPGSL